MRSLRAVLSVLVLAAAFATASATKADTDVTEEERAAELKMLRIINRGREAKDLRPLREHDLIREEAELHSDRMAKQQTLSHIGFENRIQRIAETDSGIDEDQICEATGNADTSNTHKALKGIYRGWKADQELRDCLFDGLGYTANVAGVGVEFRDGAYWVTAIIAHDDTR
jgi:uncharacterized protein YkwD